MASIKKEVYAITPGSRILVTGANGFIGAHVVQQLLSLGYLVRGTVRSQKPWLEELFRSKFGPNSFESIVIPDLSDFDALSEAMVGVRGVIHVVYTKLLHFSQYI
jgi:nucleoside-diphosphate-sugar epimerase